MKREQAQRALDALAAQAVRRANALPEDHPSRPDAEALAFKLVRDAAEQPEPLPDVLSVEQAKHLMEQLWRR